MAFHKYAEVFMEDAQLGIRWRFHSPDEGILSIEQQHYDKTRNAWVGTANKIEGLWLSEVDDIVASIKTVAKGENGVRAE